MEYSIVAAKKCPRQAGLRSYLHTHYDKYRVLRNIMRRVVLSLHFQTVTDEEITRMIRNEFASAPSNMLPFELAAEQDRMIKLMIRYVEHERNSGSETLAVDFKETVSFAGEKHSVTVHRLMKQGNMLVGLRYKYKAPEYSRGARTVTKRTDSIPDIYLLQLAAEKRARKLGLGLPAKGAIYYLKGKDDKNGALAARFNGLPDHNIVEHRYSNKEVKAMLQEYGSASPDVAICCDDPKECRDCKFNDLCNLKFVPRKRTEAEKKEASPIDTIRLTPNQSDFVHFDKGECRVNAVAGSGKTTIIVLRTIRLLEDEDCDPDEILLVTFTEKAAAEMRQRLKRFSMGEALAGENLPVDEVIVETFNGWGHKIISQYYDLLGFTEPPNVIEDITKKEIIAQLLNEYPNLPLDYKNPFLNLPNAKGAVTELVQLFDNYKSEHVETAADIERIITKKNRVLQGKIKDLFDCSGTLVEIFHRYNVELKSRNLLDYEDQLRLLLQLKEDGMFESLPYKHIIIDEFQDSNPNQIELISEIKERSPSVRSLAVVGDEMQASAKRS